MLKRVKADYPRYRQLFLDQPGKSRLAMKEKYEFLGLTYRTIDFRTRHIFTEFQKLMRSNNVESEKCPVCFYPRSATCVLMEIDCGHLICTKCFGQLRRVRYFLMIFKISASINIFKRKILALKTIYIFKRKILALKIFL